MGLMVLIVPSGIETSLSSFAPSVSTPVLIVPSGIETKLCKRKPIETQSINCT